MRRIDFHFLETAEGYELEGYVPRDRKTKKVIGRSGVTVGRGFDIGQRSRAEIVGLFVSDTLKRKLLPYAELKGEAAASRLKFRPLKITPAEAEQLDEVIRRQIIDRVERLYNSVSAVSFECIPPQAQTVLASLAINFGPALDRKLPQTWAMAITQRWPELAQRLLTFPSKQPQLKARREREGHLLKTI